MKTLDVILNVLEKLAIQMNTLVNTQKKLYLLLKENKVENFKVTKFLNLGLL